VGVILLSDEQLGEAHRGEPRHVDNRDIRARVGRGHDQQPGAEVGNHRYDDGAAGSGDAACLRQRGRPRRATFAALINDREQLAAKADQPVDGGCTLGTLRCVGRLLSRPYGQAQFIQPPTLIGGEVDRLQFQGDGEQPCTSLVGQLKRLFGLAALQGRVGGIGKQRTRIGDERARLRFRSALSEQQQERLPRTRMDGGNARPLFRLEQHAAEQPRRAQMVERRGIAREQGERRLEVRNRLLAVAGPVSLNAVCIGLAEIVPGLRPLLGRRVACEHAERRLERRDGLLLVVGDVAAHAADIGDGQVVLRLCPLVGMGIAREYRQRCLKVRNRHLAIVRLVAAQALAKDVGEVVLRRCPAVRVLLARDDRQHGLEARDRLFHVLRPVAADAAPIDDGEIVLQLRPLFRHSLVCEDGQRGLKVRDRGLLVVGTLATDALPVGDAKRIVGPCPVLGVGFARPRRQRGLQISDSLFQVVGKHAPRAGDVNGAEAG
jgi:hypothetical protein